MAEYDDAPPEDENLQPQPGEQSPALQDFQDLFTDPAAKEWASGAAAILNNGLQKQKLADDNAAAGENFVNNLDGFKQGLANGAAANPRLLDTFLDLVPHTINYLLGSLPNPVSSAHAAEIISHTQQETAAAAVAGATNNISYKAGGALLARPRTQEVLGPGLTRALSDHVDLMQKASNDDAAAKQVQDTDAAQRRTDKAVGDQLGRLLDPKTGTLQFPSDWNQSIVKSGLPIADQLGLRGAYDKLRAQGDAPQSDAYALMNLAERVQIGQPPTVADVTKMVTSGQLKLADAMVMTGGTGKPTEQTKGEFSNLLNAMLLAKKAIAPPENGAPGEAAFAKFVSDKLMRMYRQGGPGSLTFLDDKGQPTANLTRFNQALHDASPTASEFADDAVKTIQTYSKDRRNLDDIFAKAGREDQKILPPAKPKEPTPVHLPSGYEITPDGAGVRPIQTGSNPNRAPFYGLRSLDPQDVINPQGTDRDVHGRLLQEMATDTGTKTLTGGDISQSFTGPRPAGLPELTPETQKAILEGKTTEAGVPAKPRAELRTRARAPRLGRRR